MGRECRVLSRARRRCTAKAPRPLAGCDDPAVLGAPFYVMERRARRDPARRELAAGPGARRPRRMRRLCEARRSTRSPSSTRVDSAAAGLADLGQPEGYVERQVDRLDRALAKPPAPTTCPTIDRGRRLARRAPPARRRRRRSIHNDFKYDNLVLDPDDLAAHPRRARLGDGDRRRPADGSRHHASATGSSRTTTRAMQALPLRPHHPARQPRPAPRSSTATPQRAGATARSHLRLLLRLRPVQDRGDRAADLLPLPPGA